VRCRLKSKSPTGGEWWRRGRLSTSVLAAGALLCFAMISNQANACGPDFPNWLLTQGDQAVLVAPEGNFAAELAHMNLGRARVRAIPPEERGGYATQSLEAELADLRRVLKQAGTPSSEASLICSEHQRQREFLAAAIEARRTWEDSHSQSADDSVARDGSAQTTPPAFPNVTITQGLPDEFADYFEGFIAWNNPTVADKQMARAAWERLLARPEAERRYKSTWAAFMLGKSWEETDQEKAVSYFKQVRDLAREGYRDSLGLASASLGLEARVYLAHKNYQAAIETYLDQLASDDPTATNSLLTAAARALASGPESLRLLARNPRTQKVITAYVISRPPTSSVYTSTPSEEGAAPAEVQPGASVWLEAVEEANIKDVDSAEALALAAYRANDMDKARRWIKRAPSSALAQWLQAKLLLRAGKLQAAAALLARISPQFPIIHEGTNAPAPADRKDTLTVKADDYTYWRASAERQMQGELGVLRLARGAYAQALDSLLNAGFWMDAAYVAERVLTLNELKDYVDRFWPAASPDQVAEEQERLGGREVCPALLREQIRYLLARRLTRELRGDQARDYYPAAWLGAFDQLVGALRTGWDETLEPSNRAAALFQAALITRTNGMELIGTEVAPDWHYHLGEYDSGVDGEYRSTNALAIVLRPSNDELRRNAEHRPDPAVRFHYRYQAASLAWEAAKLLPDNTDQTAYILWKGGCFLKNRDPQTADLFYKALVRRNRKTILGAEADRQRWFPTLDESGNIVPKEQKPTEPQEPSEPQLMAEPETAENPGTEAAIQAPAVPGESGVTQGFEYVVRKGDSLARIAQEFTDVGVSVTPADILEANPGLDRAKLRVGQRIFIPAQRQ
jgi:LysM repeat protein